MEGVDSSFVMKDAAQPTRRKLKKLPLFLAVIGALLVLLVVPPLISIGHYKNRITGLISASLGRPARLSSVELRLLPWPGFVMTDLSVAEDPAYGAEPVLHADTVRADIRLRSLWRGRLEISSISVDDATLNLVHAAPGKWNLDPLFRTAAAKAGAQQDRTPLPYLEATNSRINIKDGAEKLPFSLVDTDLTFWQENPGEWRIRLRGQPARTDVVLDMGDTGIVRLEASVRSAPALHLVPVHADLDWNEAQLGQLSRLVLGSDPGWRGDLTGEAHLDGTPEAAHITARLRATGVHRAEFAPPSPLDFDANCSFVYHYSRRALDNLACNSPLGDGRLQLTGAIQGGVAAPSLTLELDRVPAAAGLDLLRTMRSGFAPDLEAGGTVSGKLAYAVPANDAEIIKIGTVEPKQRAHPAAKQPSPGKAPLTGSITIEGFTLSGGGLSQPLRLPRFVLEPAELTAAATVPTSNQVTQAQILAGTVAIPAGGAAPLVVTARLALYGYQAIARGQASIPRAREIAQLAGLTEGDLLAGLAGEPLSVNLTAEGPWLPVEPAPALEAPAAPPMPPSTTQTARKTATSRTAATEPARTDLARTDFDRGMRPATDTLVGTVTLRNANWRADYLANHVQIAQATLHLSGMATEFDPVVFTYGPVKGTASITLPANCAAPENGAPEAAAKSTPSCEPQFQTQFASLNAATLQNAFLGARQPGTVLSKLIDRLSSSSAPPWPAMHGTIKANTLILGPVTLTNGSTSIEITGNTADLTDVDATLLGGHFHGSGTLRWVSSDQQQPAYTIEGHLERLSAPAVGQLLAMRWTGGAINMNGTIDASGFTPADLATSAKGKLHFDWRHGAVTNTNADAGADASDIPPTLAHFDEWSGDAKIADGAIALGDNRVVAGGRNHPVHVSIQIANPPKVQFGQIDQPQNP